MPKKVSVRELIAESKKLAETDPHDEAVAQIVDSLNKQVSLLNELARADRGHGEQSMKDDVAFISEQIKKLKAAALVPARNYRRVVNILEGLERAHQLACRPQNVALRPRVVSSFGKVAGIFAEMDTAQDLDKSLAEIEKAVHSLYGDQNSSNTYNFDARGKGHHGKS